MSYPLVNIVNSTPYDVKGTVSYMSAFCANDDYTIDPAPHDWTAKRRGTCLVTEISAVLDTPNGKIQATPYTSSGTSYSKFAVIQTSATEFEVTRRVTGAEDKKPADYVEPKENQK